MPKKVKYGVRLYQYGKILDERWWDSKTERDAFVYKTKTSKQYHHITARKVSKKA